MHAVAAPSPLKPSAKGRRCRTEVSETKVPLSTQYTSADFPLTRMSCSSGPKVKKGEMSRLGPTSELGRVCDGQRDCELGCHPVCRQNTWEHHDGIVVITTVLLGLFTSYAV